jgi:cytochrome P450
VATIDLDNYDPMDREIQQCPFPHYAALRAHGPLFLHPQTGMYFVSRLDTMRTVLRDTDRFSSHFSNAGTPPPSEVLAELQQIAAQGVARVDTMLTIDPPSHTNYRKTVAGAFNVRRIQALAPRIRELTDELIDGFPMEGSVDFQRAFATPLPVRVIAHMLNVPFEREADIKRWSDDAVVALGTAVTPERLVEAARSVLECQLYFLAELDRRRVAPQDDFLTDLLNADFDDPVEGKRKLNDAEMFSIVQQLMVAGNETTTKLFTEGMKLLLEHPEWWARIQADPSLIPTVIEEVLRLASPNQGLFRVVTRDTELEGVQLKKGNRLWVMFGAADRDERVFADPDAFDPERENLSQHIAFGFGAHFCIGAPLSRLEARIGFEALAERLAHVELAPGNTFEYEPSYILRGLKDLELIVTRKS